MIEASSITRLLTKINCFEAPFCAFELQWISNISNKFSGLICLFFRKSHSFVHFSHGAASDCNCETLSWTERLFEYIFLPKVESIILQSTICPTRRRSNIFTNYKHIQWQLIISIKAKKMFSTSREVGDYKS